MIGYAHGQKGYRLRDENKLNVSVSRDVVFSEKDSPNAVLIDSAWPQQGGEPDNDPSDNYAPVSTQEEEDSDGSEDDFSTCDLAHESRS